jgi:hypothetical protein
MIIYKKNIIQNTLNLKIKSCFTAKAYPTLHYFSLQLKLEAIESWSEF